MLAFFVGLCFRPLPGLFSDYSQTVFPSSSGWITHPAILLASLTGERWASLVSTEESAPGNVPTWGGPRSPNLADLGGDQGLAPCVQCPLVTDGGHPSPVVSWFPSAHWPDALSFHFPVPILNLVYLRVISCGWITHLKLQYPHLRSNHRRHTRRLPAVPRVTGQSATQVSLEILGKIVPHLSGSGGPGAAGLESSAPFLTGGPKHEGNCFYLKKKKNTRNKRNEPKTIPPAKEDNQANKKIEQSVWKGALVHIWVDLQKN